MHEHSLHPPRSEYMMYFFTILLIAAGIYYIYKGIRTRKCPDPALLPEETARRTKGYILLGIFFIILAIYRYYTRVILWGW